MNLLALPRPLALLAAVFALGAVLAAPAHAQGLAPGTRVRVTVGDERTVGVVQHATADSLTLVLRSGDPLAFSRAGVDRIERSAGRRARPFRGALVGAGVGAFTALALATDGLPNDTVERTFFAIVFVPAIGIGAGTGALVGLVSKTDRWEALPAGSASVWPGGARVSIRF